MPQPPILLSPAFGASGERRCECIGLLEPDELSEQQQLVLKEKRAEFEARENGETDSARMTLNQGVVNATAGEDTGYPASASLCFRCNTKAMVLLDGCQTCLAYGYSKCG